MTLLLACFLLTCSVNSPADGSTHFKIRLQLDPESQHIHVNANLRLNPDEPLPDTLHFSLHEQFTIHKITGKGIQNFIFDIDAPAVSVFMRNARPLKIMLEEDIDRNKPLDIVFEYEGTITAWAENSANVVSKDWVELGMYLPWFPSGFILGYFTYEIQAECDPAYQLRSYGGYTNQNDTWYFKRTIPDFDINLVASKNLKTMERESRDYRLFFHYESLLAETAVGVSHDLAKILDYYATWFGGDKKGENFTVIQSAREKGGDYARKGLIVASKLTDDRYKNQHEKIIRNLGHEAAHLWWRMAPAYSWEDWLNESFAEYSVLLVIKRMFGEAAYQNWISDKSSGLDGIPPIWEFNRNNMQTSDGPDIIQTNLYNKGPVLLHELTKRIGEDAFLLLCKQMVASSVSSTDAFLSLVEKNHGRKIRNWFEDLLKST
jgi:hypothetical protein